VFRDLVVVLDLFFDELAQRLFWCITFYFGREPFEGLILEIEMRKMMLLAVVGLSLVLFGCNKPADNAPATDGHVHTAGDGHNHSDASAPQGTGHDVDGWCVEHGIPEEICSLCNSKVAAEFKKGGDWCKEHNRAESQCFLCDPSLKEKFATQYETKYGKKPPQ
jgi:hypothetical protein